jgi:hypothetical protein
MRNRPKETMLMIVRCATALAIAVGLIFALETVSAARAQVTVDAAKITCDQYGYKITNPEKIAIWLSGYYHGKHGGETTVDTQQLASYERKVQDYCLLHPQTLLMQAVETLIGPTR